MTRTAQPVAGATTATAIRGSGTRRSVLAAVAVAAWVTLCPAGGLYWFDAYGTEGRLPDDFAGLVDAYRLFGDTPDTIITFDELGPGAVLAEQYAGLGVHFENTGAGRYADYSRTQSEGGAIVEDLTGYDGTYMPDGNTVVVKFDNNDPTQPFTIRFDSPVQSIGAFLGMGMQGDVHSLTITVYDAEGAQLEDQLVDAWAWEETLGGQNYETFFAVTAWANEIARVEIRNNATSDFANALVVDNVAYRRYVPEPGVLLTLSLGAVCVRVRRRRH